MPFPPRARVPLAGALALVIAVAGVPPAVAEESVPPLLDQVVARLETLAPGFDAAGVISLTVIRLDTRQQASFHGDEIIKAASVIKAIWMAAALRRRGVAAVEGLARSTLWASSNEAAGRAIDAAGGLDRINRWTRDLGLADIGSYEWNFDIERQARSYPGPLRGNNTVTTDDLARFWELVAVGWALQGEERAALLEWTRGPKQDGEGQRLIARLPEAVGAASSFKMGWLPTGREYVLQEGETGPNGEQPGETIILEVNSTDSGAGIIRVPGGPSFVIAVSAYNGRHWQPMTAWVEYASCVVYSAIAADPTDCVRAGDPIAIRERRAIPDGALATASLGGGALTVSGWAVDPDAWWNATEVAITVDGDEVATALATPTGTADLFRPAFTTTVVRFFSPGRHEVCAIARNDGAGPDTAIGCLVVGG
jgi:hypothetical protein